MAFHSDSVREWQENEAKLEEQERRLEKESRFQGEENESTSRCTESS